MSDQQPSSSAAPVRVAGSEIDAALSKSEYLTQAEVLARRSRRVKQLAGIYRDHYWAMMQELKSRYREYLWEYRRSPFVEGNRATDLNGSGGNLGVSNEFVGKCAAHGCRGKAMAETKFCFMHILADPKQKLYIPCTFCTNTTSTAEPILCRKPTMRSTVPSYCAAHFDKAEKLTARALKNAGLNVPSTSTTKVAPKLHVIIQEYVSQIQRKRRTAQRKGANG